MSKKAWAAVGKAREKAERAREISEISGNTWNICLPKTRIHTLEELIKFCKIDLSIWEVERFVANKWEVGSKDQSNNLLIAPLFQIKAFLRKKKDVIAARHEIEALKELAKKGARLPGKAGKGSPHTGNMLEINISDHHFGKLAWAAETGQQNYDTKIADQVFARAFSSLLERSAAVKFDEILLVLGNDLFNSDDVEGRTTFGTHVATDVRYQKTFGVVRTRAIAAIEECRRRAGKTKVIMVPGNHDRLTVWHLGDSLECYFHKYPDVEIDNTPKTRKYHSFGAVLIMFTHGSEEKRSNLPLLMATEQSGLFGRAKFREVHTGNLHTLKVDERYGIRVRILSALCPPDAWHAQHGYVGNLRSSEAFLWNRKEGLIGTVIYTDSSQEIEARKGSRSRA